MALGETVLHERAKKLELKGSKSITFNPTCIHVLEELLHDVYIFNHPRPDDYHLRRDLVRVFNVMAKEIYGSNNDFPVVEVFGSFLMDMFNAKSDLDLSVNFSNDSAEFPREKKISALRKFAKQLYPLQRRGHVSGVHPIMKAKVPILKVVDCGTGIECDISVENKDGIAKSQIVYIISSIDERFQKLCFLMKTWAKAYDINSSKDRTLNSLSIILLVAFHLQTRDPPILPPFSALFKDGTDPACVRKVTQDFLQYGKRNEESLAELFVTLLCKLASVETLWPEGLCVSTYEGTWISKTWDSQAGNMSVEDFSDRSQNVARSVGMAEVKKIYRCIHSSIHHLSSFMNGRIQAPQLRIHLFGSEPIPTPDKEATIDLKRNFPSHDSMVPIPLDLVPPKRPRFTEGWRPWGVDQAYGETPSNLPPFNPQFPPQHPPFVDPGFGSGLPQMPNGFEAMLRPPYGPSQYGGNGLQGPVGFAGSHGTNPMFPMPYGGEQGQSQAMYNQIPFQGPPFFPYGHG